MSLTWLLTYSDGVEKWLSQYGLQPRHVLAAGVGSLFVGYYLTRPRMKYNLPPGPTPLPIIGNAIQLMRSEKLAPENFYDMYKSTYGPVFKINILGSEIVVLNNLDVVREAAVQRPDDFANRPEIFTGNIMSDYGKDILFGQNGPIWKYHRQIVHQAMRKYASGEKLQRIVENAAVIATTEMLAIEGPFDVRASMLLATFNFAAGICFGKEYKMDDPEFQKINATMTEFIATFGSGNPVDFLPWLAYVPFFWPKMRQTEKFMTSFKEFIHAEIVHHRETLATGELRDLTDYVLALEAEIQTGTERDSVKHQLTAQHFVNTIMDIFGAGIDTMTTTLQWVVILMAKYPNIQRKMQTEIDAALLKGSSIQDLKRHLHYTEAVLCEVMRKETMAPLGVPLATSCDTSVGGYDVRKGTLILLNIWALHNSPDYWDEPGEFRPERFLDSEGHLIRRPPAFIPFSTGRRQCVGEVVAKVALLGFVVHLFSRLEFQVPPGKEFKINKAPISVGNVPVDTPLLVRKRDA